jgi:hypothetical protein
VANRHRIKEPVRVIGCWIVAPGVQPEGCAPRERRFVGPTPFDHILKLLRTQHTAEDCALSVRALAHRCQPSQFPGTWLHRTRDGISVRGVGAAGAGVCVHGNRKGCGWRCSQGQRNVSCCKPLHASALVVHSFIACACMTHTQTPVCDALCIFLSVHAQRFAIGNPRRHASRWFACACVLNSPPARFRGRVRSHSADAHVLHGPCVIMTQFTTIHIWRRYFEAAEIVFKL